MLLYFSKDFKTQVYGIVRNNLRPIVWFFVISIGAFVLYHIMGFKGVSIPVAPVSIVGVALAIFLGFRNSSAYESVVGSTKDLGRNCQCESHLGNGGHKFC